MLASVSSSRWLSLYRSASTGPIVRHVLIIARYAITFGHVIIGLDHATLTHLRLHEHVHVRQYERWGVLFFPLYLASSLIQIVRRRDPYLNNCFEREAFAKSVYGDPSS